MRWHAPAGRPGLPNAPAGATLSIRADPRVAWHVVVTAERPPVSIAPDEGDWTMLISRGPDLVESGPPGLSSLLDASSDEIRIVVSCAGGGTKVDVAVTTGLDVPVGTFTANCPAGDVGTTAESFQLPDSSFGITTEPDAPMWLVVTVQERLGSRKP